MHRKAWEIEKEVNFMRRSSHLSKALKWHLIIVALLFAVFIQTDIYAVTIHVVDQDGKPITTGFRYLIEEDNSQYTVPGEGTPTADWDSSPAATNPSHTLAVNIHKSHATVICTGDTGAKNVSQVGTAGCALQANKRYLVSVIPWHANPGFPVGTSTPGPPTATPPWFADQAGYIMAGKSFAGNAGSVTVVVHKLPVPTAQITILVFHDNNPINFAYDQPEEAGLAGFNILLTDIVGKMMQDAWANPVGTTYQVVREAAPCTGVNGYCKPIKNPDGTYQFITDKGVNVPGLPLVDYMGNGTLTSCPSGDAAYDAANCVDLDTGAPLANGEAVVRFVSPNKLTIEIIPPANDPGWILTGTFEGTRGNDAWVRAAEPRFNIILGQLNYLIPVGYVKNMPMTLPTPNGAGEIKGQVVSVHDMHPPFAPGASPGLPVPNCYVGINNLSGNDEQVYTAPCGPNGTFDITGVPLGLYQLVMWDWPINSIIDFRNVTISAPGQVVDLGPTPMFGWFGTMMGSVFYDTNKNGFRDPGEPGMSDVGVNFRFADGSPYATQTTDDAGNYAFTQVFPWWQWLVMELDPGALPGGYGRFRTTGMTAVIDDGSWLNASDVCVGCANPNPPPNPNPYAQFGINPQKQPDGKIFRTQLSTPNAASPNAAIEEVGTQATVLMADMTNMIDWGKTNLDSPNPDGSCPDGMVCNGGIKGFISYATSRTQEDPGRSLAQGWEPGIPRVKVSLHQAVQDPAYPGRWVCATCTDPYDLTTCKANHVDAKTHLPACNTPINITYTDSFDDNNPSGCVSTNPEFWPNPQMVGMNAPLHKIRDCAETLRTWDQIRPGVFDGAYKFSQWCQGGKVTASYKTTPVNAPAGADVKCSGDWVQNVPPGNYVIEADPPKGYEILKWGDRNIEFGEPNYPSQALQPPCEGPDYDVPAFHTLFPDWQIQTAYPGPNQWYCDNQQLWNADGSMNPSFKAHLNTKGICASGKGPKAPLCTHRFTSLSNGQSSIVDFRMFTHVPKGTKMWGWVSDDLHLESNPNSPNASSNFAPSWIPVSIQDWAGNEVGRFYTDQWGRFSGMVPSTYTIFTPNPLGMSSGIFTVFPNDIGPVDSRTIPTTGKRMLGAKKCDANTPSQYCVPDPWYNPGLGREVIRENWDFYSGKTTFIDTIVIPTTGFVANRIPLNCDYADKTPIIFSVDGPLAGGGPVIQTDTKGTGTVTIKAINPTGAGGVKKGFIEVPNPDYNPSLPVSAANPIYVIRDHGFGSARGTVTIGGTPLKITSWNQAIITATLPTDPKTGLITVPVGDYQLVVTRTDTLSPGGGPISSVVGITFHVVAPGDYVAWVTAPKADPKTGIPTCNPYSDNTRCERIQPAIDSAPATGGLIIVGPGNYMENPIMYKPVKLQGVGAGATILDNTYAIGNLPMKNYWQNVRFPGLTANGWISTPPGALTDFTFDQGAGILVSSCDNTTLGGCPQNNQFTAAANPMIDGMTITESSEGGGGIYVNAYSPYLQISNCEVNGNQGNLSGGIRVGNGDVINGTVYTNSHNENMKIVHNRIAMNGSLTSGGGGITMYKGADNYEITNNMVCGNFSILYGGGICHFGLSDNGLIEKNVIASNESFDEGGGIIIAGELPIAGAPSTLTEGSGSVVINDNLIQGNLGGDDGGGIRTLQVNGQDVANNPNNNPPVNPGDPPQWYMIGIFNNMIVDNASGDHGGGISLDDSVLVSIISNTITHNDSTATASGAFGGPCVVEFQPPVPNNAPVCPGPAEAGGGGLTSTNPLVAGIATYALSTGLQAASPLFGANSFSNPTLVNNIVWQNRSFYWDATACGGLGGIRPDVLGLCGAAEPPAYWDFWVYGTPATQYMSPSYSLITGNFPQTTGGTGNILGLDPMFVKPYFNIFQASSKGATLGNFVQITFTPNGVINSGAALYGDYHILTGSPAIGVGGSGMQAVYQGLASDYDNQARPDPPDIGADQYNANYVWFPW